jgi:hypothetical protein
MLEAESSLNLAERVTNAAEQLGIKTALIGALALAAHNLVRGTDDVDLACSIDPYGPLKELDELLRTQGLHTKLRFPDDQDSIGGVLVIWERADEDDEPIEPVEVVNFFNPHRPRKTPATAAIARSLPLRNSLRFVTLPDLVALKLYAGGPRDHADIIELLQQNPDADVDEIRTVAKPFDHDSVLDTLISQAHQKR